MSHLMIFPSDWKTGSQCLWTSAFTFWLIFQIWNILVETIFTVGPFPVSTMDLPRREKTVVKCSSPHLCLPGKWIWCWLLWQTCFSGWITCTHSLFSGLLTSMGKMPKSKASWWWKRKNWTWLTTSSVSQPPRAGRWALRRGWTVMVLKLQYVIEVFLGPDTKNFLAGKKLGFLCTLKVIRGKALFLCLS